MQLVDGIAKLKGLGPKKEAALKKIGIQKVGDFLSHYPKRYEDRSTITKLSDLTQGKKALIYGQVEKRIVLGNGIKKILKLDVSDGSGIVEVVFFNAAYLLRMFKTGSSYGFFGTVTSNYGKLQLLHPDFFGNAEEEKGIIPVYPLTKGISQLDMRKWEKQVLLEKEGIAETLPEDIRKENQLCSIEEAYHNIHFPIDFSALEGAKRRLIFEEFLFLNLRLSKSFAKSDLSDEGKGISFSDKSVDTNEYIKTLPFVLTHAQKRAIKEIEDDMENPKPMVHLLQGDVGSGKTAVAEACMYKAVKNGYQAVLMAPTELLARQHFESLYSRFFEHGIVMEFLSGSIKASSKKEILGKLEAGEIDILVGTHALIQDGVNFNRLGLVIVDEQHRFGVSQRETLSQKGSKPDMLLMTATPIPRSLAAVFYGKLATSKLDELPPDRQKIETSEYSQKQRKFAYAKMMDEIKNGHQAYIVTPLIDYSESLEGVRSAESVYEGMTKTFKNVRTALIHGEMRKAEKDSVMDAFYRGEVDVLVSTVVIEVGINVPNATVMLIENAERFGLAQLHQLRGRVGRGSDKAYCLLVNNENSEIANERINIMISSCDGFEIAEKDLALRGPGEFFGERQHGLPELKIAQFSENMDEFRQVQKLCEKLLSVNPKLEGKEYEALREKLDKLSSEDKVAII